MYCCRQKRWSRRSATPSAPNPHPNPSPGGRGAQARAMRMHDHRSNGYQSGFGNEFATEAVAGTLPVGRNSPQRVAHGLYAEQLSGTAFTAPRDDNRRSWLYRIRPAAMHGTFAPYAQPPAASTTTSATARSRRTSCAGIRCRCRRRRSISSTACSPWPATVRRPRSTASASICMPPTASMQGRYLLRRRRRAADRAAAGPRCTSPPSWACSKSSRSRSR